MDSSGNYGYYKDGADTVTPFKKFLTKISLGSGNSRSANTFSATDIPNYQLLTSNNFVVQPTGCSCYSYETVSSDGSGSSGSLTTSYNASTGVVTIGAYTAWKAWASRKQSWCIGYNVYCIY